MSLGEEFVITSQASKQSIVISKLMLGFNLSEVKTRGRRSWWRWSWAFGYWDRGFESRSRHGCLWLCVMLSCVGRGLCDGLITRPKESIKCLNKITKPSV
jgi:hypothetical protein